MIDANVIARSHFTRKVDGQSSFSTFKRAVKLEHEALPYEYDSQTFTGQVLHFVLESWGGYENASGQWIVFMAWYCRKTKTTQYFHWDWNSETNTCSNRREYSFTN